MLLMTTKSFPGTPTGPARSMSGAASTMFEQGRTQTPAPLSPVQTFIVPGRIAAHTVTSA